jgi:hypothetical protein
LKSDGDVAGSDDGDDGLTLLQRSIAAVNRGEVDASVTKLEQDLERSGATALLRPITNKEVEQEELERSMFELGGVSSDLVGKLKRQQWTAPSRQAAMEFHEAKCIRRPAVAATGAAVISDARDSDPASGGTDDQLLHALPPKYGICSTYTGRMCFTTGSMKSAAKCDPFCEGTGSEVRRMRLRLAVGLNHTLC